MVHPVRVALALLVKLDPVLMLVRMFNAILPLEMLHAMQLEFVRLENAVTRHLWMVKHAPKALAVMVTVLLEHAQKPVQLEIVVVLALVSSAFL